MFHNLAPILSYNCWKYRVDTPSLPRGMQSDAKSNRDFGLQSFQLMPGKSFRIQEHLKTRSGEENSSNPVGHLVLTLTLDSGTFIEGLSK